MPNFTPRIYLNIILLKKKIYMKWEIVNIFNGLYSSSGSDSRRDVGADASTSR